MLIVDAQIHLWAADTPDRPWPPGGAQRAQKPYPVSKDMALAGMKEAGVDRAVIVPPSWEGERNDLALRGGASASRSIRGDGALSGGEAREPIARRGLHASARDARHALHVQYRRATALADRRNRRLALAGGRARGHSHDDVGLGPAARRRSHRRAPSRAQARHRPHGPAQWNEGPGCVRGPAGPL